MDAPPLALNEAGAYLQRRPLTPLTPSPVPLPDHPPIILIVEDDADTRELYRTILSIEGFWVADAADAASAVDQAADLHPDVIVTDLGLPGGRDGLSLARQIHGNPKTADVPVLALTGRAVSDVPNDLFQEVLQKPILPDAFVAAIRRSLDRSRTLRARADDARDRIPELIARSERLLQKSRRLMLVIEEGQRDGE